MTTQITWPLFQNRIRRGELSNTFGTEVRRDEHGKPKPHQGGDFEARVGTAVFAVGAGQIAFVKNHGVYGLQLCHSVTFRGSTLYVFYALLQVVLVVWTRGTLVQFDQEIARTGNSGNAHGLRPEENHL